ncbi:MAG TPA: phage antirepressor N-terminal domain-containing protein [Herpetosiphonaceae bacterium]|nr:phage antirepressor N-terminal domain-containing protein [Herpetosiphonaceae bacterium]
MEHLSQRIVPFHGDEIVAVRQPDGTIYVLFNRLCENLGLARWTQVRRIQNHEVLNAGFVPLSVQTDGGPQEAQCLRLDLLPLWMSGISAKRVKTAIREKLVRYQMEAAGVLWDAFKPQIIVEETGVVPAADDQAIVELRRIAEMARAIADMAEQQIVLQKQQQVLAARMDLAARVIRGVQGQITAVDGRVAEVEVRLGVLEDRLHPAAFITEEQAAEVSNRVKALAELLSGRDKSKNHYQSIFQELYRRFGVASYKTIIQDQYGAVLAFLADWRTSVS